MQLRWTKHCVLFVFGNEDDNVNAYSDNIVFYYFIYIYIYIFFNLLFRKFCVPAVTLLAKENYNLSKGFSKWSEKLVYYSE